MTRQEAQLALSALRPNDPDVSQSAFAGALALAETDPALKAWWKAQQEFDRKVVTKLGQVAVPEELRARLLARNKAESSAPSFFSFLVATAAVVALVCMAVLPLHFRAGSLLGREEYAAAMLPMLKNDAPDLGMLSPDRDKLMAWLKDRQAPLGTVPGKMGSLTSLGCQEYQMHGHKVTLICFSLAGGGVAHLFMVDRAALTNPPAENSPEFSSVKGWSTAAWSDNHMSYLLATQAGDSALKKLL